MRIGGHEIGAGNPCLIIAEAGVNHNGSLDLALQLVDAAKAAGADCVKFQTYKTERIITRTAPKSNYQLDVTDPKESQFDMLKKLELGPDALQKIIAHCSDVGIQFLSTPYSREDVDDLAALGVQGFKIASGQLSEPAFLSYVAQKDRPILLSTGMAYMSEVTAAVERIRAEGHQDIVVLQCTTNYPSRFEDAHLRAMCSMGRALDLAVGYSDHIPQNHAAFAAVAMGAVVVEKHFTLDTSMEGPDHSSSLNPKQFADLVQGIRHVETALGSAVKQPSEAELGNKPAMRRSIVVVKELKKGEVITAQHLDFKRPATGLHPKHLEMIIGKQAARNLEVDTMLSMDMVQW